MARTNVKMQGKLKTKLMEANLIAPIQKDLVPKWYTKIHVT